MALLGDEPVHRPAGAPPRLEPRTIDYSDVSLDILGTLLSFDVIDMASQFLTLPPP